MFRLIDTARTLSVEEGKAYPRQRSSRLLRFPDVRKKRPQSRKPPQHHPAAGERQVAGACRQVLVRMTSCWVARVIAT